MASELAARSVAPPAGSDTPSAGAPADLDLLLPLRSAGSLENPYPIYSLLRTVRPVMEMPIPDYSGPGVYI